MQQKTIAELDSERENNQRIQKEIEQVEKEMKQMKEEESKIKAAHKEELAKIEQ